MSDIKNLSDVKYEVNINQDVIAFDEGFNIPGLKSWNARFVYSDEDVEDIKRTAVAGDIIPCIIPIGDKYYEGEGVIRKVECSVIDNKFNTEIEIQGIGELKETKIGVDNDDECAYTTLSENNDENPVLTLKVLQDAINKLKGLEPMT